MSHLRRHIQTSKSRHYGGGKSSELTIRELLKREGYSEVQIQTLKSEARVVLIPGNFGAKVKGTQELYVLEKSEKSEKTKPKKVVDRFARLDLE